MTINKTEKFNKWFLHNQDKSGGLITQVTGARLLGITRQSVTDMINAKKLKKYEYTEKGKKEAVFIGLNDVAKAKMKKGK
ncbi:MAG: hypothetical protein KAS17_04725 [Victivallaceae bacterium]|nr:hypothetical protein [Victivallaceae bacterium]